MGDKKSPNLENLTDVMNVALPQLPQPVSSMADTETKSGTDERLTLLNLAGELQNLIILNLHPEAAIALSQTNRHFHSCASLHRLPLPIVSQWFHEKEMLPENSEKFACYTCLRLKPQSAFVLKQTKKKKSKFSPDAGNRFCIDCGCKYGKITPGHILKTSAGLRVSCIGCEKPQDRFCTLCYWCDGCASKGIVTMERRRDWVKPGDGARKISLKNICEGHSWEGRTVAGGTNSLTVMQSWAMYEFESEMGMIASPEWYDGPDDI